MDIRVGKKLLRDVVTVFREYGVDPFLQCGTALGAYRDKGFIEWDKDIDLAVLYEEGAQFLRPAADTLKSMGYKATLVQTPLKRDRVLKVKHPDGLHADVFVLNEGHTQPRHHTGVQYQLDVRKKRVVLLPRTAGVSTTELRNRIKE